MATLPLPGRQKFLFHCEDYAEEIPGCRNSVRQFADTSVPAPSRHNAAGAVFFDKANLQSGFPFAEVFQLCRPLLVQRIGNSR
jgi:hypothetical protein